MTSGRGGGADECDWWNERVHFVAGRFNHFSFCELGTFILRSKYRFTGEKLMKRQCTLRHRHWKVGMKMDSSFCERGLKTRFSFIDGSSRLMKWQCTLRQEDGIFSFLEQELKWLLAILKSAEWTKKMSFCWEVASVACARDKGKLIDDIATLLFQISRSRQSKWKIE